MLGNSNQQPEHGHLTLERRRNSSFHCTIKWACSKVRQRGFRVRKDDCCRAYFPYLVEAAYRQKLQAALSLKRDSRGCFSVPAHLFWDDLSSSPLLSLHTVDLVKSESKITSEYVRNPGTASHRMKKKVMFYSSRSFRARDLTEAG